MCWLFELQLTWTLNTLYLEWNLIFLGVKNLIMFWILPDVRNWATTDFDLVIVEGSKLGMKSHYNCRKKSRKKIAYIVREYYYFGHNTNAGTYFNFKSDFNTQTKVKNKNRFQWLNIINIGQSELGIFIMFSCWKSVFVFHFCLCVKIGLGIKICSCVCLMYGQNNNILYQHIQFFVLILSYNCN